MARSRTLANLRADVRYYADIEGLTDRHPDANVNRLINESWQALRELVTEHGSTLFLSAVSGTLTTGALTPDASGNPNLEAGFGTVDFPADCLRVHGVDVEINGTLVPCEPLPFASRNDFQDWWSDARTEAPFGFFVYDIGQESTTSVGTGKIGLVPAPDQAYPYTIWYLKHWTDLTTDTHVFHTYAGWERWVVWDCVVKIAARDNDSRNTHQIALQERAKAEAELLRSARPHRAGVTTVQNSRERKRSVRTYARRWEGS